MSRRDLALEVWGDFHGLPYLWGGDDPVAGFDCSGLVIEGLKACGILPRDGDWTAAGLREHFRGCEVGDPELRPGCLLFWTWGGARIVHVEPVYRVIGDLAERLLITLGASGGGSRTTTREDAIRQNAYVKIRPARPGWAAAVDPFLARPG